MVRRSLLELVIAVVGGSLIGFGLNQAMSGLGWSTAIGVGLLLLALVYFALSPIEGLIKSGYVKYILAAGGILLVLLPGFQA